MLPPFEQYQVISGLQGAYRFRDSGGRELIFYAAHHNTDPANPMFGEIKSILDSFKPDLVLLESYDWDTSGDIQSIIQSSGESAYTARLAEDRGIPWQSAEIGREAEMQAYIQRYGEELVGAFMVFRQVGQYFRTQIKAPTFELEYRHQFEQQLPKVGITNLSWERLVEISEMELHLAFPPLTSQEGQAFADVVDPTKTGSRFNEISRYTSYVRDRGVLERLANFRPKYQRIFVVMGASHFYTMRPALEELYS